MRNEGGYGGEVGHKKVGKIRFPGQTPGGFWMKRGYFQGNFPMKVEAKILLFSALRVPQAETRLTVYCLLYIGGSATIGDFSKKVVEN